MEQEKRKNVKIGVLGGIGPESTTRFYKKIIGRLQQKGLIKKNEDYPQILINSIPAPELVEEDGAERKLESYIKGLKELDRNNVDFIVMVCNTIHLYRKKFSEKIGAPILDLRSEVKKRLLESNTESVLILGSSKTIENGLYEFDELENYKPEKSELEKILDAVLKFNKGVEKDLQTKKVMKVCNKYLEMGVDRVVLGCTEFAVMLEDKELPALNTIDVLVDTAIDKFCARRNSQ